MVVLVLVAMARVVATARCCACLLVQVGLVVVECVAVVVVGDSCFWWRVIVVWCYPF